MKRTTLMRAATNIVDRTLQLEIEYLSGKLDKLVSGENIKTVNNNSILGSGNLNVKSNHAFPDNWPIDTGHTFLQLCAAIADDPSAVAGMTYLGGVKVSGIPEALSNGELLVEVINSAISTEKVLHFECYSANVKPYIWTCTYWKGDVTPWVSTVSSSEYGHDILTIWRGTQAEYNALEVKDSKTLYITTD